MLLDSFNGWITNWVQNLLSLALYGSVLGFTDRVTVLPILLFIL